MDTTSHHRRELWLRPGSLPIFFRLWQITCKPKEGKKKEGGTPTMKRVLRKIIDNAVPLWYAKDKGVKIRLSKALALQAAWFLKLYCQWQSGVDCKWCPFKRPDPDDSCNIGCRKNPEAWDLNEEPELINANVKK